MLWSILSGMSESDRIEKRALKKSLSLSEINILTVSITAVYPETYHGALLGKRNSTAFIKKNKEALFNNFQPGE
jgi:hypothetical protein